MSSESWGGLRGDRLPLDPSGSSTARDQDEIDEVRAAHHDLVDGYLAGTAYTIPGMNERPDGCGAYVPMHVCDECGEPIFTESQCGLRRCPECWWEWVLETAENIVFRLMAYRWAQESGLDRRLIHGMFSRQRENWTIRETEAMMGDSYSEADDAGVSGGVGLKHMWRTKKSVDSAFQAATAAGLDGGKWRYLRDEYGDGWRSGVNVAPHVHQIAVAPEFEPEQGEWVADRIRTLEPMYSLSDREAYEDVAGLAKYLLTHTAIRDGEQAVRWFGDLYPGGFDVEEELSKGARDTIARLANEAVYGVEDDDDDDDDELPADVDEIECLAGTEGCTGEPMQIWDAPAALRRDWFDIDRATRKRIETCVAWMMGDLDPPPCMSESEARATLDRMVEN